MNLKVETKDSTKEKMTTLLYLILLVVVLYWSSCEMSWLLFLVLNIKVEVLFIENS